MIPSVIPLLNISRLCKRFNGRTVLHSVDLVVPRNAILCLLGRSGTGKSVLLKCLGGLLSLDAGDITSFGNVWASATNSDEHEHHLRSSFLFQQNALFDSITALENVELPLHQTTR